MGWTKCIEKIKEMAPLGYDKIIDYQVISDANTEHGYCSIPMPANYTDYDRIYICTITRSENQTSTPLYNKDLIDRMCCGYIDFFEGGGAITTGIIGAKRMVAIDVADISSTAISVNAPYVLSPFRNDYDDVVTLSITDTTITSTNCPGSWQWIDLVAFGVRFFEWDYTLTNTETSYPAPVDTQLQLCSEDNADRDWEIRFLASRIDNTSAIIDFGVNPANNTQFGGAIDTWNYSTGNGFRWLGLSQSGVSCTTVDKEWHIVKNHNTLTIYVDGTLVKTVNFAYPLSTFSTNSMVLGKIAWKGSDLYNVVHWDYFKFRWLS